MQTKHKPSERGQVLILLVFGVIALLGLTGLAIDGGNAFGCSDGFVIAAFHKLQDDYLALIRRQIAQGLPQTLMANFLIHQLLRQIVGVVRQAIW